MNNKGKLKKIIKEVVEFFVVGIIFFTVKGIL